MVKRLVEYNGKGSRRCFYIALLLIASCSKPDTYCWQCHYDRNNGSKPVVMEYCDKTTDDIKITEQAHTTGKAKMSCAKKY